MNFWQYCILLDPKWLDIFSFLVIEERAESPNGQNVAPTAKPFQLKKEKSTAILLAIIVVFLACHLLRFIVQVYEVVSSPLHGGQKLFQVSTLYYYVFS